MDVCKNRLQWNSKFDREDNYLVGQSFNLPELKYYSQERAWDYLRSFDLTSRNLRQNLLNHYKDRLNIYQPYLNDHPITINLVKDNIALLEKTLEHTVWYQPEIALK